MVSVISETLPTDVKDLVGGIVHDNGLSGRRMHVSGCGPAFAKHGDTSRGKRLANFIVRPTALHHLAAQFWLVVELQRWRVTCALRHSSDLRLLPFYESAPVHVSSRPS